MATKKKATKKTVAKKVVKKSVKKIVKKILTHKKPVKRRALTARDIIVKKDTIVWKRAKIVQDDGSHGDCIVKLKLPTGTDIRIHNGKSVNERKCRASHAIVIAFYAENGKKLPDNTEVVSQHNKNYQYKVNSLLKPDKFDTTYKVCSNGIHFFVERKDAKQYCWG